MHYKHAFGVPRWLLGLSRKIKGRVLLTTMTRSAVRPRVIEKVKTMTATQVATRASDSIPRVTPTSHRLHLFNFTKPQITETLSLR